MRWVPIALLVTALGCSEEDSLNTEVMQSDGDTGRDDQVPAETNAFDDAEVSPPSYWRFSGILSVTGGEVDAEGSRWIVGFSDGVTLLCPNGDTPTGEVELTSIAPSTPNDESLLAWWSFDVRATDESCPYTPLPSRLSIGIGPPDPRLAPAIAAAGRNPEVATNTAFVAVDAGPAFVFGLVGTAEQLDGAVPATTGPLSDGDYEVVPLYLLPIGSP